MKLPVLLAALALASCAAIPPEGAGPSAALGQVAETNGIRVRPIQIIEDSRCPADVQCIWAGRLVVRSVVATGSWNRTLDLELGKPQHVADGSLALVSAVPPKAAGAVIDPRSYRFTFDFQGGL